MRDQLQADIVSVNDLQKAVIWLRSRGYLKTANGTFEKGPNKIILHTEGIFVKKGISTIEGIGFIEMISLLKNTQYEKQS